MHIVAYSLPAQLRAVYWRTKMKNVANAPAWSPPKVEPWKLARKDLLTLVCLPVVSLALFLFAMYLLSSDHQPERNSVIFPIAIAIGYGIATYGAASRLAKRLTGSN